MLSTSPSSTLFPYTTLFRSGMNVFDFDRRFVHEDADRQGQSTECHQVNCLPCQRQGDGGSQEGEGDVEDDHDDAPPVAQEDRKSTRLNSSHLGISYAVFCLK